MTNNQQTDDLVSIPAQQQQSQQQQQQSQQPHSEQSISTPLPIPTPAAQPGDKILPQARIEEWRRQSAWNWSSGPVSCEPPKSSGSGSSSSSSSAVGSSSSSSFQLPSSDTSRYAPWQPPRNLLPPTGTFVMSWNPPAMPLESATPDPDTAIPSIETPDEEEQTQQPESSLPSLPQLPQVKLDLISSASGSSVRHAYKRNSIYVNHYPGTDVYSVPPLLPNSTFRPIERSVRTPPPMPQFPTVDADMILEADVTPDDNSNFHSQVIEARSTSPTSQDEIDYLVANVALRLRAARRPKTAQEVRAARAGRAHVRGAFGTTHDAGVTVHKEIRMRRRKRKTERSRPHVEPRPHAEPRPDSPDTPMVSASPADA